MGEEGTHIHMCHCLLITLEANGEVLYILIIWSNAQLAIPGEALPIRGIEYTPFHFIIKYNLTMQENCLVLSFEMIRPLHFAKYMYYWDRWRCGWGDGVWVDRGGDGIDGGDGVVWLEVEVGGFRPEPELVRYHCALMILHCTQWHTAHCRIHTSAHVVQFGAGWVSTGLVGWLETTWCYVAQYDVVWYSAVW